MVPRDGTGGGTSVSRHFAASNAGGDALVIPYSSIIKLVPQELWGKLAPAGVATYNYTISRKSVLEQIPHGAVKVSFGELRRGAPVGVFVNTSSDDTRLVDLPLSEILAQLHPDSLSRRQDQSRVEVSAEVPDLFGNKGERLASLRVMEKKEVSGNTSFVRQKGATTITPRPGATASQPASSVPPNNITPLPTVPAQALRMHPIPSTGLAPAPRARATVPAPLPMPKLPVAPAATSSISTRQISKMPAAGAAAAHVPEAPASVGKGAFLIALDAVASSWPDGVRQELAQLKIPEGKLALPSVDICEGLKRGRIQYAWRTLRSWIQPTPFYATPSPHDDAVLELPLRTLTPLFLEYIRANPGNRQTAEAGNITEFFRKAEQATGTSADLLQPLFAAPAAAAPAGFAPLPAAPAAATSAAAPASAGQPSGLVVENGSVCLPVAALSNCWPEPVTHDIASFGLAGSRIEIPLSCIEPGLKSGKIEFSWRELCGWLNPPSKSAQVSINGEHPIALPLGLIAPLFMKARGAAQIRKRTNVHDDIPDLFSAAGQPVAQPPAPDSSPAAAQTPAAPAAPPKKAPTNLSELFGEPDKKTWTPNEIVQRSTKLPNIAGTLIALQDGLLVASNMPSDMKSETIAAFVPQIFGRMNQYSKELQMGDIRAVSFTVEAGTIQVYNAGIIYFAAFGRKGVLLPLAELQLIAGELSRHTK